MGVDLHRRREALPRLPADVYDRGALERWSEAFGAALIAAWVADDYWQHAWGGWSDAVVVGCLHGWKPEGTRHPDPNWTGTYFSNDGARVTERDAHALANALQRALSRPQPLAASVATDDVELPDAVECGDNRMAAIAAAWAALIDLEKREPPCTARSLPAQRVVYHRLAALRVGAAGCLTIVPPRPTPAGAGSFHGIRRPPEKPQSLRLRLSCQPWLLCARP
jgi:hypothetical protein